MPQTTGRPVATSMLTLAVLTDLLLGVARFHHVLGSRHEQIGVSGGWVQLVGGVAAAVVGAMGLRRWNAGRRPQLLAMGAILVAAAALVVGGHLDARDFACACSGA